MTPRARWIELAALAACVACGPERQPVRGSLGGDARAAPPETTLTLVTEKKLAKIVSGKDVDRYEASGIAAAGGMLYVASDNLTRIAAMDTSLDHGTLGPGDVESSQYEALTVTDDGRFYAMVETAGEADPRGKVVELDAATAFVGAAFTDVAFKHANQGFEGAAWVRSGETEYLLALCENNGCKDDDTTPGKGRVKVLSFAGGVWTTQATVNVPDEVQFLNYSDLALRANGDGTYAAAIVSRKSAAVWLGTLETEPWAFAGPGAFYGLPLTADGEVQYCSLEGITFLGPRVLALASDRSGVGDPCSDKDQSVHIFQTPL